MGFLPPSFVPSLLDIRKQWVFKKNCYRSALNTFSINGMTRTYMNRISYYLYLENDDVMKICLHMNMTVIDFSCALKHNSTSTTIIPLGSVQRSLAIEEKSLDWMMYLSC